MLFFFCCILSLQLDPDANYLNSPYNINTFSLQESNNIVLALVRFDAKSRRNYRGSVIQAKFRQGSSRMRSKPISIWIKRVRYTKQTVMLRPFRE